MFLWTLALCVASTLAAVPMPSGSFMGYFSNEEIEEYANALHKRRPMFVSAPFVIGHRCVHAMVRAMLENEVHPRQNAFMHHP